MISVIICSANKNLLIQIIENITTTIGVPFEIIAIDNSENKEGICAVYNKGILKAKYDILCFIHEDVLMKTDDWGQILIPLFNADPGLGLVGVAGSSYKSLSPSMWGGEGIDTRYMNIIQSFKFENRSDSHDHINPRNEKLSAVTCVDGVWLCTPKSVALEIGFDESLFKGFHCYDIDFSLAVGKKYKVAVTFELLINHFSEGNYDHSWIIENIKLYNKWITTLPRNTEGLTNKQMLRVEGLTFKHFISQLIAYRIPLYTAFKILWKNNRFLMFSPKLFFRLNLYLAKTRFKYRNQTL